MIPHNHELKFRKDDIMTNQRVKDTKHVLKDYDVILHCYNPTYLWTSDLLFVSDTYLQLKMDPG